MQADSGDRNVCKRVQSSVFLSCVIGWITVPRWFISLHFICFAIPFRRIILKSLLKCAKKRCCFPVLRNKPSFKPKRARNVCWTTRRRLSWTASCWHAQRRGATKVWSPRDAPVGAAIGIRCTAHFLVSLWITLSGLRLASGEMWQSMSLHFQGFAVEQDLSIDLMKKMISDGCLRRLVFLQAGVC